MNRKLKNSKTIHHSPFTIHYRQKLPAFTLIEVLLVIGMSAILFSFATINLLKPQQSASINSTVTAFISDVKEQQIKAMAGDTETAGSSQNYGVHVEQDSYTLFRGNSYLTNPASYFIVNLDPSMRFTTFPQDIIFAKRSGELTSPVTITINNIQSGEQKTLSINNLGAININ